MSSKAPLILGLVGIGGALLLMKPKKAKAAAVEVDDDDEIELPPVAPPISLPEAPRLPPLTPPEELPLPRIPFDDRDEKDKEEEELIVRSPAPQPQPTPQPAPQLPRLPDLIQVPEVDEDDFPIRSPGLPQPAPRPAPQPAPAPRPAPVQPDEPEQATELADDTARVLGAMLGRESTADWKRKEPLLGAWQRARGLKDDQQFGPGTALQMAEETGLLPIIRFWPKGAIKEAGAVEDYAQKLIELAQEAEEPRRSQLFAAAEREQGQGFGRNPKPITPLISI